MPNDTQTLIELAAAKAAFQQRTLEAIVTDRAIATKGGSDERKD